MHLLLALAAAASWGTSDFLGGLSERRSGASIALAAQVVGLVALLVTAPLVGGEAVARDFAWGAAAGLGAAMGLLLLYRALAVGTMGVVAPVTAAVAAAAPAVYGLANGERPPALALGGVVLALVSVILISAAPTRAEPGPAGASESEAATAAQGTAGAVVAAMVAGAAFGAYFICLSRTGDDAGLWPLVGARTSSVQLLCLLALLTTGTAPAGRPAGATVVAVGLLDAAANVSFLLASRQGLLSLTALVASLYPVVTVGLARTVLGERLNRGQAAGLAGAAGAVALIAVA